MSGLLVDAMLVKSHYEEAGCPDTRAALVYSYYSTGFLGSALIMHSHEAYQWVYNIGIE